MSNKPSKRHYTTSEEDQILHTYSEKYKHAPKRSEERKHIREECSRILMKLNPRWTPKTVRTWFRNNVENIPGKDKDGSMLNMAPNPLSFQKQTYNPIPISPVSSISTFSPIPNQYMPPMNPLNQPINQPNPQYTQPKEFIPTEELAEPANLEQNELFFGLNDTNQDHSSNETPSSDIFDNNHSEDHPFKMKPVFANLPSRSSSNENRNKVTFGYNFEDHSVFSSNVSREPSRPSSVSLFSKENSSERSRWESLSSDSENKPNNQEEITLPEIPKVGDQIEEDDFDQIKYDAYNKIQEINHVLRLSETKFPENSFQQKRLKFQQEAETKFVSLTNILSTTLGIDQILSHDPSATLNIWKEKNDLRRIASATTRSYNKLELHDSSAETSANISRQSSTSIANTQPVYSQNYIFVPRKVLASSTTSEDVVNFYNGNIKEPRKIENIENVEVSTLIQFQHCKTYIHEPTTQPENQSNETQLNEPNETPLNENENQSDDNKENGNENDGTRNESEVSDGNNDDENQDGENNSTSSSSEESSASSESESVNDDVNPSEYEFVFGQAMVNFSDQLHAHMLVFGEIEVFTGFFLSATSIYFQRKHGTPGNESALYICGDHRVKEFTFVNTKEIDAHGEPIIQMNLVNTKTFYATDEIIGQHSTLAVFNGKLVLANGSTIYLWEINKTHVQQEKKKPSSNKKNKRRIGAYEFGGSYDKELAQRNGINNNFIDWTKGNPPDDRFTISTMKKITSMCVITDDSNERIFRYLAVASDSYPVIYIYNNEHHNIARLISHTMGITSLLSYGNLLFSGSKDCMAKLWNIYKGTTCMCFEYHGSAITAMACGNYLGKDILFTGGDNSLVRCWSISDNKSLFEINLGRNLVPTKLMFLPDNENKTARLIISSIIKDDENVEELTPLKNLYYRCQIQTFVF